MKKALLLILVVAAFSQAKAQQLFQFKPANSLTNNPFERYFQAKPYALQPLFHPQVQPVQMLASVNTPVKISAFDHMPVAVLQGSSKMPVVKLGGFDGMPILKPAEGTVIVVPEKQTP
jgi:hypothetical protein